MQLDRVLFVDVGASITRASLVEYAVVRGKQTVTVKASAWDDNLGGLQATIDYVMVIADVVGSDRFGAG